MINRTYCDLLNLLGPFFAIPAVMLVDMYHRIHRLIGSDSSRLKGKKKAWTLGAQVYSAEYTS
jgi:hypothetical protein